MRWVIRGSRQQPREAAEHPRRDQDHQDRKGKKSKAVFPSFSPLAWLSKLTGRSSDAASAKPAEHATPAPAKSTAQPAASFLPHFHKPASTSPASSSQSSPSGSTSSSAATVAAATAPHRGGAGADTAAADSDVAPRRRSVGNDDAESDATTARRHTCRRRHYSVGGDRDLMPLGHLISLSRSASPKPPPIPAPVRTLTPPPLPPLLSESDRDEDDKRPRRRRRGARRAGVGRRRSFSNGKATGARVRSPRVLSELERFAVVRRTRDPQREFRASMVEMIASKRMVGRPEELETLLACYLSLNADEHHDCIVKVFRQVWFELNNNNSARVAASSPRS